MSGKSKEKTKKVKTSKIAKANVAKTMPAYPLSAELAAIVGASELSRGAVMKKVWDYIKTHQLQDTTNKRLIHPDSLLAKVFGSSESIDMFKIAGLLNGHIKKK